VVIAVFKCRASPVTGAGTRDESGNKGLITLDLDL